MKIPDLVDKYLGQHQRHQAESIKDLQTRYITETWKFYSSYSTIATENNPGDCGPPYLGVDAYLPNPGGTRG